MFREGAEDKDAVHGIIPVQPVDLLIENFTGHIFRKDDILHADTHRGTALHRAALITQIVALLADSHDGERRLNGHLTQHRDLFLHFFVQRGSYGSSL